MIWLTDAALRYAVDLCCEIDDYRVTIYTIRPSDDEDTKRKMHSFTKNKHCEVFLNALNWHADFENGSIIRMFRADNAAIGYRCNLAIAAGNIDQNIIDEIIRPSEMNQRPNNAFRGNGTADNGIRQATHTFQEGGHIDYDEMARLFMDDDFATTTGVATHTTAQVTITPTINDTHDLTIDVDHITIPFDANTIAGGFLNADILNTNGIAQALNDINAATAQYIAPQRDYTWE